MIERYLVLDSDPDDNELRWRIDRSVRALLDDVGFEYRYREGDPQGLERDVWEGAGTEAILSLVADHHTPSHYVLVESKTEALADRVADELKSVLPVVALEQWQDRAAQGDDPSDIVRMAQAADPVRLDDRSAAIIAKGLEDDEDLVRYRSAQAAGLAPRKRFRAVLEQLAHAEGEDPAVREIARIAARACADASSSRWARSTRTSRPRRSPPRIARSTWQDAGWKDWSGSWGSTPSSRRPTGTSARRSITRSASSPSYALGLTPVVFVITGMFFLCTAATYAEATAMYPEAGGSSSFARRAFNEFWSFFAAWGQMLNYVVTVAISAFFVPHYLGSVFWERAAPLAGRHHRAAR